MKRNILLISFNIFFLFCFIYSSCELPDTVSYGDGPAVQGNVTITGLDAYNGNYVTMYGHMNYNNKFSHLIGTTKLTKKAQYGFFVVIREDSLNGAQIANGSVKIPYYAMQSNGNVYSNKLDLPFGFLTVRFYINTEKSINFKPSFSTENVISTAMMPVGWQESRDFTLNKSQLTEWFDF